MLVSFKLHNGKVPTFIAAYLPYACTDPSGDARASYLGVVKTNISEYVPPSLRILSDSEFVDALRTAHIMTGNEDSRREMTDGEKDELALSFLAKNNALRHADHDGLIDRATGQAINAAIHPFCSTEEQLGILRDQLVQILNALGLEATTDFSRLNDVAIAAIEKAGIEKESLDA